MEIEELITEHEKSTLKLTEFVSVSELAAMMSKSPNDDWNFNVNWNFCIY